MSARSWITLEVGLMIALAVVLILLGACQSPRSGQMPSCLLNCTLTAPTQPAAPAEAVAPVPADEEIIIPPSRRSIVIRRFR